MKKQTSTYKQRMLLLNLAIRDKDKALKKRVRSGNMTLEEAKHLINNILK